MKSQLLILVVFLFTISINAQFGPKQIISENIGGAEIYTVDIDGDDDLDILTAGTYQISWFENLDGLGNFGQQQLITDQESMASAYASDLDGDGDLDVIVVLGEFLKPVFVTSLVWYENLDGLGDFGGQQIIEEESIYITYARSVYSKDFDGDGDMDVLTGSQGDLFWYENLDGLGNFSEMKIISSDVAIIREVYADDLDGDGDIDVLACTVQDDQLTWYENLDGQGNFGDQQIIATDIGEAWSIDIGDLNGDGYKDVLTATYETGEVSWYDNIDGQGNFGVKQIISTDNQIAVKVSTADLDGDGDLDVFSSTSTNIPIGILSWHENINGQGTVWEQQIIHQEEDFGFTLFIGDIDNDSDFDLVGASATKLAWFENLAPLSIEDNDSLDFTIHPNPVINYLQIENTQNIISLNITDASGRLLMVKNDNFNTIDVSNLSASLLFVNIEALEGTYTYKIINK